MLVWANSTTDAQIVSLMTGSRMEVDGMVLRSFVPLLNRGCDVRRSATYAIARRHVIPSVIGDFGRFGQVWTN